MITIKQWISQLEEQELSSEDFYGRLLNAKNAIEQRLEAADFDGVDIEELSPDDDEY